MTGRGSLILCCEGQCSDMYRRQQLVPKLRAAGWSPESVRGEMSSRLKATTHHFHHVDENRETQTRVVYYECAECSHVRVYGAEEM